MTIRFLLNENLGTAKGVKVSFGGWDVPATKLFANSLITSVLRQYVIIGEIVRKKRLNMRASGKGEPMPYPELDSSDSYSLFSQIVSILCKKESLSQFNWGVGKSCIRVDVYHSKNNGGSLDNCRISIEEDKDNPCSVRISNLMPDFARVVYAVAYLLKAISPPRGYECLRNINIIRDFSHYKDKEEKLSIVRHPDGSPKEVVVIPRQ